ncbi:MAG: TolC family outer membrane protein [Proteobacteria bacterium]|nr:TolC family outer membrane protein [Pseudomonadota bacterium]MBS0573580.1 TolC family outer membrane protein [Pseudomonadota bacterium]
MNTVMRRTFRLWSGTAALAILISGPAAAESLGNALRSAYKNSNLLAQNQAVLRAADEDVAQAATALRPVVSWILQSKYSNTQLGESTTNSLALGMDWPLYDFGRSQLNREAAKETVLATRQALIGVEQNVLLAAVSAYMDVHRAIQDVANNQTSVRVIGEELKATQDRFAVGEVTRTDVAQAEASLAAARAALSAAEGSLEVARAAYKAAIGHDSDGRTSLPPQPAFPKTLAEAKGIAVRLHPAVLQAQHQARASDLKYELARAQKRPSLDLSIQAGKTEFGENATQGTIQLSQPLFTGGKLASGQRQALAGRDAARAALVQTGVGVEQQVADTWSQITVARAQIGAIDQQIVAAQSAYEGVKNEAALGARTTLDVLDAESAVLTAQSSRTAAESSLQVANYSLLAAMGLLTAENLKLGIPTYDPAAYYDAVKSAPPVSVQGSKLDRVLKAIGKK